MESNRRSAAAATVALMMAALLTGLLASPATPVPEAPVLQVLQPAGFNTSDELQMQSGQNLTLQCDGVGRVAWIFPMPSDDEEFAKSHMVPQAEEMGLPSGRWRSTLRLRNASFFHTGFYRCVLADAPEHSATLYVYVADPECPFVHASFVTTTATEEEDLTLDCRPNNRSLHVTLYRNFEEQVPLGFDNATGQTLRWAPTAGFTLSPVHIRDSGMYTCRALGWDNDLFLTVSVIQHWNNALVSPPAIRNLDPFPYAVLGKTLRLQCYLVVKIGTIFTMKWILPESSTAKADWRMNASEPTAYVAGATLRGETNLTITRAEDSDFGNYTCEVNNSIEKLVSTFVVSPERK